jgi:hypothetical protein
MIEPKKLIDYAVAQGWELLNIGEKDGLHVLTSSSFPGRMLTFPMAIPAPDHDWSAMMAIKKLSRLQGGKVSDILSRVSRCVG